MEKYEQELQKFNIGKKDYPDYTDPENFAKRFKRCSVYEYGTITYSNSSLRKLDIAQSDK